MEKSYEVAIKAAGDVGADETMNTLFDRLDSLDLDDLNGCAGRTRQDYVESIDVAWELFEKALDPFIGEMKKNQKRALSAAVN